MSISLHNFETVDIIVIRQKNQSEASSGVFVLVSDMSNNHYDYLKTIVDLRIKHVEI